MRRAGRRWLVVDISGTLWDVRVVNPATFRRIKGCEGLTVHNHAVIYIASDLSAERKRDVLFHELIHSAFFASGMYSILANETTSDVEESVAQHVGPCLYGLLRSNPELREVLFD